MGDRERCQRLLVTGAKTLVQTSLQVCMTLFKAMQTPGRLHTTAVSIDKIQDMWLRLEAACAPVTQGLPALRFVLRQAFCCQLGAICQHDLGKALCAPALSAWVCSCQACVPWMGVFGNKGGVGTECASAIKLEPCEACASNHFEYMSDAAREDVVRVSDLPQEAIDAMRRRAATITTSSMCVGFKPAVVLRGAMESGGFRGCIQRAVAASKAAWKGAQFTHKEATDIKSIVCGEDPLWNVVQKLAPTLQAVCGWMAFCGSLVAEWPVQLHPLAVWNMGVMGFIVVWQALHEYRKEDFETEARLYSILCVEGEPLLSESAVSTKSGCLHAKLAGLYFDALLFSDDEGLAIHGQPFNQIVSMCLGVLAPVVTPFLTDRLQHSGCMFKEKQRSVDEKEGGGGGREGKEE